MEKELTPQQSFELINKIIDGRRATYEENGHVITLWGVAVMIAGIGQYILLKTELAPQSPLIWLATMVPMFIYSFLYGYNKSRKTPHDNQSSMSYNMAWLFAGVMSMLNGFIFPEKFGLGFTTVMYLPLCVAALVTAISLERKMFIFFVILAAVVAYVALFIPFRYHSLIAALIGFLLFFLPGLSLKSDYKKRQNV